MPAGKRETILAALFAALGKINRTAYSLPLVERNPAAALPAASDETRPALRQFDGDADGRPEDARAGARRGPWRMTMQPAIWGYVSGPPDQVGTLANELFEEVCTIVRTDTELLAALGSSGVIVPTQLTTAPAKGENVEYDFGLTLSIFYEF